MVIRIVALTCSNTEIVCALGCSAFLVGVDNHSDFPEDVVSRLPRVGPDLDIDVEKVTALNPDLVLASLTVPGHERIIERLEGAGLDYLSPEPVSLEDVYADIRLIAGKLGVAERGEELVTSMQNELQQPENKIADSLPRLVVEWWPKPVIVPGRQSWVTDMIQLAGAMNPMGDRDVKSAPVEAEEICRWEPDAIIISWCGVETDKYRPEVVYERPGTEQTPAVRNKRVYKIPEAYLGRPGPRLVEGFRMLRRIVEEVSAAGSPTP